MRSSYLKFRISLSVESWPGALQITQKHIMGWKIGLEAEMGYPVSEAYSLPVNATSLVGSVMANLCETVWYPEHSNLCLIWDVEEVRSIRLPDHQQKVTLLVVSSMLALRWMEENVTKNWESKAPTAESMHTIDNSRRLEFFETACKKFAIPMEIRQV